MNMYFLALVLPEELNEKILPLKQLMFDRFECAVGLKSPAHITLIPPFWMGPDAESHFIQDTDLLSSTLDPFTVSTNNFSSFRPRTIFIDVVLDHRLREIKRKTEEFFGTREQYPVKFDTRPFHPHITIATRDLHKRTFHEAFPLFENRTFREEWTVQGLSVLRHNKKNWDVIHTSQFRNL